MGLPVELRFEIYRHLFPNLKSDRQVTISAELLPSELRNSFDYIKKYDVHTQRAARIEWFTGQAYAYTSLLATCRQTRTDILSLANNFELVCSMDQEVFDALLLRAGEALPNDELYVGLPWEKCAGILCETKQRTEGYSMFGHTDVIPVRYSWNDLINCHWIMAVTLDKYATRLLVDKMKVVLYYQNFEWKAHETIIMKAPAEWPGKADGSPIQDFTGTAHLETPPPTESWITFWPEEVTFPLSLEDVWYYVQMKAGAACVRPVASAHTQCVPRESELSRWIAAEILNVE